MRAVLLRVPEGVWVMKFGSVRRPEKGIFFYRQPGYVQRCSSSNLHAVPLSYHKSTSRLMFLKTALRLKHGGRTTEENQKEQAFHIVSYTATHTHTHTHFFCFYFTQGKKWLQKSFSQKPLRKLLQWQTNTLGAPFSQERDIFLRGNILYSKHQNLSCGQHPKKRFWINQPLQTKGLIQGMYTSMQKYQEGQRSWNRPSLPAKHEGDALSNDFTVCRVLQRTWAGSSLLHFLHLKQSLLF